MAFSTSIYGTICRYNFSENERRVQSSNKVHKSPSCLCVSWVQDSIECYASKCVKSQWGSFNLLRKQNETQYY